MIIPLGTAAFAGLLVYATFPQRSTMLGAFAAVSAWGGCGLLLISLLLMIREPRLARWLGGLEVMYRWHHLLGMMAYVLLLAHPLALAASASSASAALGWAVLSPWSQGWPARLGWLSLLCMMAGLALALHQRLPYAVWRRCHLVLAVSVVFGAAHLLALDLAPTLMAAPLLAVVFLTWRVLRADYGLGARPFTVTRVESLGHDSMEVTLQPLSTPVRISPGQFVLAAFHDGPGFHGCGEYHPFTVTRIAVRGDLSLGIKGLGDCSRRLQSVQPGVAARLQGPFGTFAGMGKSRENLWVAGGIGITPFIAALRDGHIKHAVRLVYLYRQAADAAYLEELHGLARRIPLLRLQPVATGNTDPNLRDILPGSQALIDHECYLCGPPGMVDVAIAVLGERGVAPERIHSERFDFR